MPVLLICKNIEDNLKNIKFVVVLFKGVSLM